MNSFTLLAVRFLAFFVLFALFNFFAYLAREAAAGILTVRISQISLTQQHNER